MTKKVWSIVALVIILAITLGVAQFVPQNEFRYALCLVGGVIASSVQKHIAK